MTEICFVEQQGVNVQFVKLAPIRNKLLDFQKVNVIV